MTVLRNLHLYGSLADEFGAVHEVAANTIPDAIRIVNCNHPTFLHKVRRGKFHCLAGEELEESTEMHPHQVLVPRSNGDFHLVPVAEGGKGRTGKIIFSIVVGGALLATGVGGALLANPGTGLTTALGASTGILGISYGTVALMGGAMLLGGLNQLLTPTPKVSSGSGKTTSFTFSGPASVNDEGGAIPIVYGEVVTSGITIASSIQDGRGATAHYGGKSGLKGLDFYGTQSTFSAELIL